MSKIHSIMSGDGTICLVVDGRHYTASASHPAYADIRKVVTSRPLNETALLSLLDIPDRIAHLLEGKVRVDLNAGKVFYNDTEFHDEAFCERILRLMAEGQDVSYLVNFLNNLGENPEFRAIMETFKFICKEGMPITPDGCFMGYKGVRADFYDRWTGTILNLPDGRRVEEDRDKCCNDPGKSCAEGLHLGSYNYAKGWGGSDGTVILVKVNPRDVVSVPNHECEKMRVCGYWVIKDFGMDRETVLQGEVYDSNGQRVPGARYTDMEERGQLDNDTNSHWDEEEGRTYSESLSEVEDEIEPETCPDCGEYVEDCVCEEDDCCPECGAYEYDCDCDAE